MTMIWAIFNLDDRAAPVPNLLGALHDQVVDEDPPAERALRHRPPRVPPMQEDVLQQGHPQEAPGEMVKGAASH